MRRYVFAHLALLVALTFAGCAAKVETPNADAVPTILPGRSAAASSGGAASGTTPSPGGRAPVAPR